MYSNFLNFIINLPGVVSISGVVGSSDVSGSVAGSVAGEVVGSVVVNENTKERYKGCFHFKFSQIYLVSCSLELWVWSQVQ